MEDAIELLLRRDALADAEKITHQNYKDDESGFTSKIGLALHMQYNEEKRQALDAAGDLHWNSTFGDAIVLATRLGFEVVLADTFPGTYAEERYQLWWNPEGVLLKLESFTWEKGEQARINNASIYYNWEPNKEIMTEALWWNFTSSGHFIGDVWIGDHDVREAFAHKLNRLRKNGRFLPSWIESPIFGLVNYYESKQGKYGDIYKQATADKLNRLPFELQSRVCHI